MKDELCQHAKWKSQCHICRPINISASNLNDVLCDPWPLKDVLNKLVEAADILLNDRSYDGHGYEQINAARDKAVEIIKNT